MSMTSTEQLALERQVIAKSRANREATLTCEEIQLALERMDVRVNASHAHRESLGRAAEGIKTVNRQLSLVLNDRAASLGRTGRTDLARSAIDVMRQQHEPLRNSPIVQMLSSLSH